MGYSKKVFEQTGEGVPSTGNQMPQNGIQNVQNLEAMKGFVLLCRRKHRISP